MSRFIEIVEVGPRDGLQNEKTVLDVGQKLDFIRRLDAAGARRMEVVSFVNPNRVPQMAGAEEVMADLSPDTRLSRIGLVLNMRGWERAVASGCDEANVVVCASDGFGIRNQGASVDEQIAAMHGIAERRAADGGVGALWLEDIGVAGIDREVVVEVIDQRGKGRDFTGFLGASILHAPLAPGQVVGLAAVFKPTDAAADHQ